MGIPSWVWIVLAVVLVGLIGSAISYLKKRKARKAKETEEQPGISQVYSLPNTNNPYPKEVNDGNSERYAVSYNALPHNFDYSAPGVEVKEDHVVVPNLNLLERNSSIPTKEEYQPPPSYNPNY